MFFDVVELSNVFGPFFPRIEPEAFLLLCYSLENPYPFASLNRTFVVIAVSSDESVNRQVLKLGTNEASAQGLHNAHTNDCHIRILIF